MTKSSEWAEAAVVAGKEVPPLPATTVGTMLQVSRLFIRREKIIVHPADEFVQGPLFHPKWSAQYPLSFSV